MKAGILVFPGTNCEHDLDKVLKKYQVDTEFLWYSESFKVEHDLYFLPGGFSYGDYLRSGAMASRSLAMESIKAAADQRRLVTGICNGFQILTEAGLLPGALTHNIKLKHICKWVDLKAEGDWQSLSQKYESYQLPVSHSEGNYICQPDELKKIEDGNQVILRYTENINGSANGIAGLISSNSKVVGLMPHPERALHAQLDVPQGQANLGDSFFEKLFSLV